MRQKHHAFLEFSECSLEPERLALLSTSSSVLQGGPGLVSMLFLQPTVCALFLANIYVRLSTLLLRALSNPSYPFRVFSPNGQLIKKAKTPKNCSELAKVVDPVPVDSNRNE